MAEVIRAAVCSRHPVTRFGIEGLLAAAPESVAVVDLVPASPAMSTAQVIVYDAVDVLDRGDACLRAMLRRHSLPVVAVAPHFRPDLADRSLGAGAAIAVDSTVTPAELAAAIASLVRPAGPAGPATAPSAVLGDEATSGLGVGLTAREMQVLRLLAQGLSDRDIAEQLDLGVGCVRTRLRAAYRKMGVTSRAQAVLFALTRDSARVDHSAGGDHVDSQTGRERVASAPRDP